MIIPVLGIPRSGTSLLAGILHTNFKIPMGEKWLPRDYFGANWQPEEGFYTDLEFFNLHQELLKDKEYKLDVQITDLDKLREYQDLIYDREMKYPIWGVKCHLLPFVWSDFVLNCEDEVRLLKTWRCPDKSIKSYMRCTGMSYAECRNELDNWHEAVTDIWDNFHGPKLEVHFSNLIESTEEINRIAKFIGLETNPDTPVMTKQEWVHF